MGETEQSREDGGMPLLSQIAVHVEYICTPAETRIMSFIDDKTDSYELIPRRVYIQTIPHETRSNQCIMLSCEFKSVPLRMQRDDRLDDSANPVFYVRNNIERKC